MFDQLARGKPLVRGQPIGGGCEVLDHGLLLHAQIGVTKFGPYLLRLDLVEASINRIRETQCSSGTLPENCDNFWNTLMKIIWQMSSSGVRRGRWARTILATSG